MSDLGPQAAGGDHAAREPIRVLVVEDSSSGAAAVLDAIEQGGLRPAHLRVQSPAELERALAHPDGWDVVLTAAALQSWSGLDAIRMVVALRPQLPVLMVSGAATEEQAVAAMRAGAADCVLEDNLSRLGPALRRALAEARRRRRHEHALRELRLAHTSLDGIRDAVFWMDRAGRIVLANEAACRAFGRPRAELLGRPIGDVLVALGDGSWSEHWRGLEERGRLAFESALPTAGGGLLTVAVDETLLVFEGEAYVLALVRDVTAEREAERRSRQAMAETSALLEGARAVLDEPTFELSAGRILRSCLRLVGADAGYMGLQRIGEPTWDVLVVETGARARQADPAGMAEVCGLRARACQERRAVFANELEGGAGLLPEGHLALDNALVAPLMLEREVAGVLALANKPGGFDDEDARAVEAFAEVASVALKDLRTRQALAASAEQVQRSERRYRRTFETAANLMTSVDAQGTIVDCNERALEVLGYRPDELIGRPMGRIIHPDCHARAHAALETTLREGQLHGETYRMVRKDGEAIDVRINSSAIREGDEGDARTLCVIDDITERNRIQTRLAQSDRLASVGMLAAGVAHEVNNPLTYILYNLESLRVELPEVVTAVDAALQQWPGGDGAWDRLRAARRSLTELAECAAVAQDGARRVARIVRDLKTFSRTDEEDRAPIDVELVIESALSMVFHEVKYRATVVKDYGRVPAVVGNEGRLGQVFLNLLLNAAQAIDEGAVRANEIRVRTYVDDGWAVSVDLVIGAMLFWVASGLWLWWELKATRRLGALAFGGGLGLFGLFLLTI